MGGKDQIEWFVQLSKAQGYLVRELAEMPVLFRHLEPVMDGFNFLSSSRQLGAMGGVGPISLGDMIVYLNWTGVQGLDEQKRWVRLLRAMDNAYLLHVNAKE